MYPSLFIFLALDTAICIPTFENIPLRRNCDKFFSNIRVLNFLRIFDHGHVPQNGEFIQQGT